MTLAYESHGDGTPVVLLHAFPLDRGMYAPQVQSLAKHCRLVLPDLPGFGGSPVGESPTIDAMAGSVLTFLDDAGLTGPVVLGGTSMGGYVALAFARLHPKRLRGLILIDTRAEPDSEEAAANRDRMIAFAKENTPEEVVKAMLPKMLGATTHASRPAVVAEVKRLAARQTSAGVVAALHALKTRKDSVPHLSAIGVPTLVVVGAEDALTPPDAARVMADGIPGAQLSVIDAAGHLSNLENPEAFDAAVVGYLGRVGGS